MHRPASSVILVRPTGFAYDPQTAATNDFQQPTGAEDVTLRAMEEFDGLLSALDRSGIGTTVLDPFDPVAPNAVFPNNWFSTHADGTLVLYPMQSPSRRSERDPRLGEVLLRHGWRTARTIDLTGLEADGHYLEGTGSLVIDRGADQAYAALSPRTTQQGLDRWCQRMGHRTVTFLATANGTLNGPPVYHTNVVISIGSRFALCCFDAMPYPAERDEVRTELERAERTVVPFDREQMHAFVGNVLELSGTKGPHLFMSGAAFRALRPDQRRVLELHGQLVPVEAPVIESVGGGSIRCMLAENMLPAL